MSKARSHNRTVIAMAALAVLASLALFGGAEAAFGDAIGGLLSKLIGSFAPKGFPAGPVGEAAGQLIEWAVNNFF